MASITRPPSQPNRLTPIWNILTLLVLLGILCVLCLFVMIYTNPRTALNPLPPPTNPPKPTQPKPTATPLLPSTWTPTPTLLPTATETPRPTHTTPPTATSFSLETLFSPTPSATTTRPPQGYPYEVQKDGPMAVKSTLFAGNPECNWMGVGGQVTDFSNAPVMGIIVRLGGSLPGVDLPNPFFTLTGVEPKYGESGYQFVLADRPITSKNTVWIQIFDQVGVPLSDKIYFETHEDCARNLILINFKQVR